MNEWLGKRDFAGARGRQDLLEEKKWLYCSAHHSASSTRRSIVVLSVSLCSEALNRAKKRSSLLARDLHHFV